MKIAEKTWLDFKVEELFDKIEATKGKTTGQLVVGDDVPYIAAAKTNNGYSFMCSAKEHPEWISKGNAIVFVQLGDGAAGLAHYIPMDFIGMSGKTSSGYNSNMSEYNGIFIAKCLSTNKSIFSHGHSWTGRRLLATKTMLPVDVDGNPDYAFMNEYVGAQRKVMLGRYKIFACKQLSKLQYKKIPALSEKAWATVILDDIFTISSGTRLETRNKFPGNRPFIGAADNNNGVTGFVSNNNASNDSNVLGVNYNGNGMCIGFYHPYECIFSDDVKRFHLKKYGDNPFVLLFFKVIILQQKSKFGYLYKFNGERMAKQRLLVPVNDVGEPDYAYMEQYAKNMMLRKYIQYLAFLDAREREES